MIFNDRRLRKIRKSVKISYATLSKTGNRWNNEDAFRVIDHATQGRWFGIVCDGMGGHSNGEVASETIINAICDYWETHSDEEDASEKVVNACKIASKAMDEKSDAKRHTEMGSTMVMASIKDDIVTIAHLGDSRCYLQRIEDGVIYQTQDHTGLQFGWEVVEKCFFSYRHEIVEPEIRQFKLKQGDRLLICSDGLYKSIVPDILTARMMDDKTPEQILDVYDFLYEKSGDDNYTGILAIIE